MIHPAVLFTVFALLAVAGAYLVGAHFNGRRLGVVLALAAAAFFAALHALLEWLLASRGASLP